MVPPSITMPSNKPVNLEDYLKEVASVLRENLDADAKRHLMNQELREIEDKLEEIIVVINEVLEWYDYDPTPSFGDGEPPCSADERHAAAWKQHQELHS